MSATAGLSRQRGSTSRPTYRIPGGPGNFARACSHHPANSATITPPTIHTARSFGGCTPITRSPAHPNTEIAASGRYQAPRCHGPISVQVRPWANNPSAVGTT